MKIISFNINGLRARIHQLAALIEKHQPDVIGLQEIKVDNPQFPIADIEALGYHAEYHGQKGHYGVALLSKLPPIKLIKGMPTDPPDAQTRLITGTYPYHDGEITVINGYFPQGESRDHETKFPYKKRFYADLMTFLNDDFDNQQSLVVMGDINISPTDLDIGIGEPNRKRWLRTGKCSFLPEEREWLATLQNWGLTDSWRSQHPTTDDVYSWFDYRSRGFDDNRGLRIDVILATDPLMKNLQDTGVDYPLRGIEKPSDHAPIWATFE